MHVFSLYHWWPAVTDYIKNHEQRMAIFLKTKEEVSADEARQLGLKSIDEYPLVHSTTTTCTLNMLLVQCSRVHCSSCMTVAC